MSEIFNISASNNFVETLAARLLSAYGANPTDLATVLIFLPNRRACLSLAEAFVRLQGMKPSLLPQMRAIGDINEEDLILTGDEGAESFAFLPPTIDPLERKILFMKLIMSRYQDFGLEKISLSQACFLAEELGGLIDKADLAEKSWDNLKNLVPEEYAAHWQETLKFLQIITAYWPEILKERGVIDAGKRKNLLIAEQCRLWQTKKPSTHIIVAGTTAVSPSMKLFVKTVLGLEHGEVFLAGLDKILDEEAWQQLDETHPQFELKQLLDYLGLSRNDVKNLCPPQNLEREKLISEIMRPASCSDTWRHIENLNISEAVKNLSLLTCKDSRLEALSIALLIRRALETPEKTIALVTPDRTLARRVSTELLRWNISIDDSAGLPLKQTRWGIFMRLVASAAAPSARKKDCLALFKSPLFCFEKSSFDLSKTIQTLDKKLWRQHLPDEEAEKFLDAFAHKIFELKTLLEKPRASLENLLKAHIALAEELSSDPTGSLLWQGEEGATGAAFLANWLEKASLLDEIETADYLNLFETMMSSETVHPKTKTHPRIKILGPMEARLNHYDELVLGGFNEGIWPPVPTADAWMSRPMKKEFGFDMPEKQIGVLGLDFSNLFGAPKVYLTRAATTSGTQTVKSRWLMRLETVLQALNTSADILTEPACSFFAEQIDKPEKISPISPPAPTPPVALRPRRLSASAIEKLMRDPYDVFARYILKLIPLEDLEQEADAADFGNIVHKVLEDFARLYPEAYPENAEEIMLSLGQKAFAEAAFDAEKQSFWIPKFTKMVHWIAENETSYRRNIRRIHAEVWGHYVFENAPAGKFEVYAKADRIDETTDGKLNIIDYKTGRGRSAKEIKTGYAPQLPIEALIASAGGFEGLEASEINEVMYWKLGKETLSVNAEETDMLPKIKDHLSRLINLFDFESTPYLSRPNPKHVLDYADYEHLARVKEWSVISEENE